MSNTSSQINCKTTSCRGVLGAWNRGDFIPSAHLKPGRDLWIAADGKAHVRCSFCGHEYTLIKSYEDRKIRLELT